MDTTFSMLNPRIFDKILNFNKIEYLFLINKKSVRIMKCEQLLNQIHFFLVFTYI